MLDRVVFRDVEVGVTDDDEIRRLYVRHRALVRRTIRAKIRDDHVVDDLAAKTWECAVDTVKQGRAGELRAGWFVVVANRRIVDYRRQMGLENRRQEGLRNEAIVAARLETDIATNLNTTLGTRSLLAGIGERQRRALVLRYLESGSVSEVAKAMGLSYIATESLLARARRSARQRMAETSASASVSVGG